MTPLLLAVTLSVFGQEEGLEDDTPSQLWLRYQFQQKVGEKTRIFGSLYYQELLSRERFLGEWTKLSVRAGGSYDLGERFRLSAGADIHYTYHPDPVSDHFEFRLWQGGTAYWPDSGGLVRRFVLSHRLRLEERFTDSEEEGFGLRLRYRLETKIPLNTYSLEPGTFYLPLAVELFADIAGQTQDFFAQDNRAAVGLGYVINKNWTVDLRYQRLSSRSTAGGDFDTSSNVIDFTVKTSIRIRDLVKNR